jgi:ParB-like chromosome segregation protein Spo0J
MTQTPNIDNTIYDAPVSALLEYPGNPRQGSIEAIAESLRINGQYRPIVVRRETREILAGNHTWKAAKSIGWKTIKVTYVEALTDQQAARIVLADNRYNDIATYSVPDLTALLEGMTSLEGTGFDQYVLTNLEAAFTPLPVLTATMYGRNRNG